MLVRVMYTDGHFDMVKASTVDALIGSGKIVKFYRSGHWAMIGSEPVRGMGGSCPGHGRRESDHEDSSHVLESSGARG